MATSIRDFFGFILKDKDSEKPLAKSVVSPNTSDGSIVINSNANGGIVGEQYMLAFDPEGQIKTEVDLIRRYRELARFPEVAEAIEDIVNEAIVTEDDKIITLNLDELKLSEGLKKKIIDSFDEVLIKLEFRNIGHEIFRNWYVDGKLLYQIILDEVDVKKGIRELRYIDPRKIKKIKNVKKETLDRGVDIIKDIEEYYIYNDKGIVANQAAGVKLSKDSVVYCHSGIIDTQNGMVQQYLHKAIRPANQLKMLEEAVVIYRYTRAPERRVFYIDVGNLPKGKAEQYVSDMMNKFKNKLSYDAVTGEIVDSKRHTSMIEDYWLPRRDGCFTLDTKVRLLDGRDVDIGQLAVEHKLGRENWTYSVDNNGHIVPGKISWAGVTRLNSPIMEVHLDNGEVVRCTHDHKFILRNGTKTEARNLQVGTSLMPFNTTKGSIAKKDYDMVMHNDSETYQYVHRMVSEYTQADINKQDVVHHVDFNRFNNNPSNLRRMDKQAHLDLHVANAKTVWELGDYESHCKNLSIAGKRFFETDAGAVRKAEISQFNQTSDAVKAGAANGRDKLSVIRSEDKLHMSKDEYLAKWQPGLQAYISAGHAAALAARKNLKEQMTPEEYKQYCAKPGECSTHRMKERHANIDLQQVITVIKNVIHANPRASNKYIIESISTIYPDVTLKKLRKYFDTHGYDSISDVIVRNCDPEYVVEKRLFNQKNHNHKVINIVWCDTPEDVGTLTIDEHNTLHDYHNFALSAGIFVMNQKGTEISTLPGGQSLNQLDDLDYFLNKLYHALNVPVSRMKPDTGFSIGRSDTISRDEIKFQKFIEKLRVKFNSLFTDLLRVQLVAKGVCTLQDWDSIKDKIKIQYAVDNHFEELKSNEILNTRLASLSQMDAYVGKYVSKEWVQKHIMKFTDEEIIELNRQIQTENTAIDMTQQADAQQANTEPQQSQ